MDLIISGVTLTINYIESMYKIEQLAFFRHSLKAFGIAGMTNNCNLVSISVPGLFEDITLIINRGGE